jgi:modulator of FtsH protease HflK
MRRSENDALFSAQAVFSALRGSIRILRWGMIGLLIFYLASGITIVRPGQLALIQRGGRLLPQIYQPGLLFAFPRPFDSVLMVPSKKVGEIILNDWIEQPGQAMGRSLSPVKDPYSLTGDTNIVKARFSARYQVSDPIAYLFAARNPEVICRGILYDVISKTLAGLSVDDVLTTRRDFVAEQTRNLAQAEIDRLGLGIQLIAFEVSEIEPPAQVLPAFQDVISASVEAKTLIEPANAYRASAIPEAQAQAFQMNQEAESYAHGVKAKAEGEVSSFAALTQEYVSQPQLVQSRLYNEMLEKVLPAMRVTTVLPSAGDRVRLFLSPKSAGDGEDPEDKEPSESK